MTDFIKEGIKKGDRVYSLQLGWSTVEATSRTEYQEWIYAKSDKGVFYIFMQDGRMSSGDACPSVFWGAPQIIAPPKPKRKIQVTKWVNVYKSENGVMYSGNWVFDTEDRANSEKVLPEHVATTSITFEIDEP